MGTWNKLPIEHGNYKFFIFADVTEPETAPALASWQGKENGYLDYFAKPTAKLASLEEITATINGYRKPENIRWRHIEMPTE